MVKVKEDLTGRVFGRLTVLEQAEDKINSRGEHIAMWRCQCSCEKQTIVIIRGADLKKKNPTQSCGCLQKEITSKAKKRHNKYDLTGIYGVGWTTNTNEPFYFDLEDYNLIKDYCWVASTSNGIKRLSAYNKETKKPIRMHVLLGFKNCDHIDKNELNHIKRNFRQCTHQRNDFNRDLYSNNTSGITGVCWHKVCQKWKAAIMIDGKTIYLGVFSDKDEAIKTRLQAEAKYMGKFAPQIHLFERYGVQLSDEEGE